MRATTRARDSWTIADAAAPIHRFRSTWCRLLRREIADAKRTHRLLDALYAITRTHARWRTVVTGSLSIHHRPLLCALAEAPSAVDSAVRRIGAIGAAFSPAGRATGICDPAEGPAESQIRSPWIRYTAMQSLPWRSEVAALHARAAPHQGNSREINGFWAAL